MSITELQKIQTLLGRITNLCKNLDGLDVIAAREVKNEIHYIINEIADNIQEQVINSSKIKK